MNGQTHRNVALVDRGANGCIAGSSMAVIERTGKKIDLSGIDDHTVRNLEIVTAGGVVKTQKGDVIMIIHQAAHMPDAKTIISAGQLEWFRNIINDKARRFTKRTPSITTLEGYRIPMRMEMGLPYIDIRPFRKKEYDELPHVVLTSPHDWDPSVLDSAVEEQWYERAPKRMPLFQESTYDEHGNIKEEDGDEAEMVDANTHEVSRTRVKEYLRQTIDDEVIKEFVAYEVDGTLHDRDYETQWDDEYFLSNEPLISYECYPATTRGQKKAKEMATGVKTPKTKKDKDSSKVPHKRSTKSAKRKRKTKDSEADIFKITDIHDNQNEEELDFSGEEDTDSDAKGETVLGFNNPAKQPNTVTSGPFVVRPSKKTIENLSRYFPGANEDVIRSTLKATTQYGTKGAAKGFLLRDRLKAPNPVLNVPRRHEDVATDTLYSDTPSVDGGHTAAQFFLGRKSHFRTVTPLGRTDKAFVRALQDQIRRYGAMDRIISDNARAEISAQVQDILRTFVIDDWQSEPHNKNQNFAERGWRDTKAKTNLVLNMSGAPPEIWLLALEYICFIQNHMATDRLGGRTPVEWLLGYTPDISSILQFVFWEPVYYSKEPKDKVKFPSQTDECLGRFVGISEHVGHAMTYKVLSQENKIIHRAVLRTANKRGGFLNRKAIEEAPTKAPGEQLIRRGRKGDLEQVATKDQVQEMRDELASKGKSDNLPPEDEPLDDPLDTDFVRSAREDNAMREKEANIASGIKLPTVNIAGLVGRTFIPNPDEHGDQPRSKVVSVEPTESVTADNSELLYKFRCKVGDRTFEEIMTYNRMRDWCDRDLDREDMYKMEAIVGHKRNRTSSRGWDLKIRWEGDDEETWNQLGPTYESDAVMVAIYAKKHGLLDTDGFRDCKRIIKSRKKLARMINQARLKNLRNKPVYKYGYQVPRNHAEAVYLDERNGNTLWQDAEKLEIQQLLDYECFDNRGKGAPIPRGYKRIPLHFVYDVKHDGRHKARCVCGGHRTDTPVDSVYSGVVSLPGVRIVTYLAEHNDLELWGTDIGNAYLESFTKEKVCFVAGPEFGELEGCTLIILKAQYGLRSSGARWHDKLFDVLSSMGFSPSKAEGDIWMKDCGDHYEYIACYVDDLMIASRKPQSIIDMLTAGPHSFKLKGTGPVSFHLGCDYYRDQHGTLCVGPKRYIERMITQHESLFGCKPKQNVSSPLERNDHPELDVTDLIDDDGIRKYQSLLGILQWTITLGRFDIATAVATMSSFRVAPRQGHLDRLQRICGYLSKMRYGVIRVRTEEPDYSDLPVDEYDWAHTVYGKVSEEIPSDAPKPLGKRVVLTSYVDANLFHDVATGRAVTGVLHFVNQTPIDWFSKKQPTVETATYGSEFVAAKQATQQIMGLRTFLRYLGVRVQGPTNLFGDNGSVVTSGSLPHSPLRKRHHALAYHYTREAVASSAVAFRFIPGDINPADILSKHWAYSAVWPFLQPILFWEGNTSTLLLRNDDPGEQKGSITGSILGSIESEDPEPVTDATPRDSTPITKEESTNQE